MDLPLIRRVALVLDQTGRFQALEQWGQRA
jgi:hypothetical protein